MEFFIIELTIIEFFIVEFFIIELLIIIEFLKIFVFSEIDELSIVELSETIESISLEQFLINEFETVELSR